MDRKFSQATVSVRAGLNNDEQYGCVVPPITLSSTYNFLGFNKPRAYDYSRRSNPTRDVVQRLLAELETGGIGSIITSSGMSAIYLICMTFLKPGDLVIAPHDCYGGTYRLLCALHERGLYEVNFVDQSDYCLLMKLSLSPRLKLVFIETPSNPLLRVVDISAICKMVHESNKNALCIVDNTFMSPVFQQPLVLGADLVIHSCTKYLNGHSDLVSGVVVVKDSKYLSELTWWANVLGISASAFDSYQLLRGVRTLTPRILQQQRNAQDIICFLENVPQIEILYYPGLLNNSGYNIAVQQQRGFGAIFSFELDITKVSIDDFLSSLRLFTLAESFGGVESLIAHPATMTHAAMSKEVRDRAGISDRLFRVSVGIEDSNDLIYDLKNALGIM
ncbi:cystathionine gamma-synthase [Blochmannia endosymbiont of Polyrhachis (Hedomyrma) turneri]|uniref:cystathionine gamma-synthase n=1 Tax=Blochmannia endosymbiont of Polyrhachis (Hedomyrma) turneri TaxID=1505596 RepID=UPI00061A8857|nr:cystathionine gamma-synthase [Blochmannia endosymbiont of Polyrhachis (Hedomyrma) turneri]AKC60150.1 Cystathionine gamma-synthase [Blochmannia endosymbiont of Polyrhachis (Hedomyrma) turneri]